MGIKMYNKQVCQNLFIVIFVIYLFIFYLICYLTSMCAIVKKTNLHRQQKT